MRKRSPPRTKRSQLFAVATLIALVTSLFGFVPTASAETGLLQDPPRILAALNVAGDAVAIRTSGRLAACGVTYSGPVALVTFAAEEDLSFEAFGELAFAAEVVEGTDFPAWVSSSEALLQVHVRRLLRETRSRAVRGVVLFVHRDLANRPVCDEHTAGGGVFSLDDDGGVLRVPFGFAPVAPPAPPPAVAPPVLLAPPPATAPVGALGTCKGPKTISQMREELIPAGYPGPFDQLSVLAAWQRTACAPAPTAAAPAAPAPTGACTSHGRIASSGPTSTAYGLTPLGGLTEACAVVGEVNGGPLGGFVVIVPAFTVAHIEGHHGWTSWFVDPAQAMAAAQNSSSGITARTGSAPRLVDLSKGETFPLLKRIQRG